MAKMSPMRRSWGQGLGSPLGGWPARASRVRGSAMKSFTKPSLDRGSLPGERWGSRPGSGPIARPAVSLRREGPERFRPELLESAQTDTLPHPPHHVKVEEQVVHGHEGGGRDLPHEVEVAEVGPARAPAGGAGAVGVGGPGVVPEPRVADREPAFAGGELAVAGAPRGHDAVEHVDPA